MIVVQTVADCRNERVKLGKVAFVPTMGALHDGHLSLLKKAKELADHVVVSIFVNPTQFGPREDFNKYPRPIESDLAKCDAAGATLVFNPSAEEMYRENEPQIVVDLPQLTEVLEGKHRPGHFRGVLQVVAKLFNIVQPQYACFGQKDYQQLRVLSAMVETLNWPIQIVGCPTVREKDGLAMSSRNQYLSPDERIRALTIHRGLMLAEGEIKAGEKRANRIVASMQHVLLEPGNLGRVPVSIDYAAAVDPVTLKPVDQIEGYTLLAIAARVGSTRLIDNVLVSPT
jgi:pantoate--beta-alanine ligase